jgi:hypothetical protein
MEKPLLISFIFVTILSLRSYSQDSLSSPLEYSKVVNVDTTLSSKELYNRARAWFAETYRSAQDVIQMDDKEIGKIIGKGNMKYVSSVFVGSNGTKGWIRYTISIQVKDGRYKYDISNFLHEGNAFNPYGAISFGLITNSIECPYKTGSMSGQKWKNKVWKDIKETIEANISPLSQSIISAMGKPAKAKDSDW